jgi:PqqD family protein of HPr-rel-A system
LDSTRWGWVSGFALHWRSWDSETVVYHEGSGETHLLGPIESAVLARVHHQAATRAELAAHLEALLETGSIPELADYVGKLLNQLMGLGLIEPQGECEGR